MDKDQDPEEAEARAALSELLRALGVKSTPLPKRKHKEGDEYYVLRVPALPVAREVDALAEKAGLGPFIPSCVPVAEVAKDWEVVARGLQDPKEAKALAKSMNLAHQIMSS
jgi:hypothetical protein